MIKPTNRREIFMKAIATGRECTINPATREEIFLDAIADGRVAPIAPVTREEMLLAEHAKRVAAGGGSGGGTTIVGDEALAAFLAGDGTTFTVPADTTNIREGAFFNYPALEAIEVADGSEHYTSIDGVLYNKDVTSLIAYPTGKPSDVLVIPSTVTDIKNLVCIQSNLNRIEISGSIETYGERWLTESRYIEYPEVVFIPDPTRLNNGEPVYCVPEVNTIVIGEDVTFLPAYDFTGSLGGNNSNANTVHYNANCTIERKEDYDAKGNVKPMNFFSYIPVDTLVVGENVTAIPDYAFYMTPLWNATIPRSVTSIGVDAFYATAVTIHGYAGSYAETWATENGFTFEAITE